MEKCQPYPWTSGFLPLAEEIFQLTESFLGETETLYPLNINSILGLALLLGQFEEQILIFSYPP